MLIGVYIDKADTRHFKKDKKAENEIRTRDPRITNALLYQLSYFGVKGYGVVFKVYLF